MTIDRRFQLFVLALGAASLVAASSARAQHATATEAPHVAAVHPRPISPSAAAAVRAHNRTSVTAPARASFRTSASNFFGGAFDLFPPIGTTGLGTVSSGLMNQDWAIKAAIDPATEWRLFEAQRFLRNLGFVGPGFYLLDDGAYYEVPSDTGDAAQSSPQPQSQQQQPIVIVQAPQASQSEEASAVPAPEETSEAMPDVGEFVLVLRNGSSIEAVAFTLKNDQIVYITGDGLRRTIALADLDTPSTLRVNEERGTPVQL